MQQLTKQAPSSMKEPCNGYRIVYFIRVSIIIRCHDPVMAATLVTIILTIIGIMIL